MKKRKDCRYILNIIVIFFLIFNNRCIKNITANSDNGISDNHGYPRLAMWWPDTWNQSLNQLTRYDWIGFGEWDNMEKIAELKEANPAQKHFMNFSITETSWSDWTDKKSVMEKIPSEWFLTRQGSILSGSVDAVQTTVYVDRAVSESGDSLFKIHDLLTCEFESMQVTGVDQSNNAITIKRGSVRRAASHKKGVRIAAHITFWPESWVMNMLTMCPEIDINEGMGPETWIDFASRHFQPDGEWDGYIVDIIEEEQSWLIPYWCSSIDPDCLNKEVTDNYAEFDAAWYYGCKHFLELMHGMYPSKVLISNTSGAYYQILNGAIYEGFPGNWSNSVPETYDDWAERALGEKGYIHASKFTIMPNYSLIETYEDEEGPDQSGDLNYDNPFEHSDFVPDYQKMRFGLTTALLGNGYFSYEINTNGHGSLGLMWFDEYDNAGNQRGYLGLPAGDSYMVKNAGDGSVWEREFEKGIVICNPTNSEVTVQLKKKYRLIDGTQAPEINSGQLVTEVTLQPQDGMILLKE